MLVAMSWTKDVVEMSSGIDIWIKMLCLSSNLES